MVFSFSLYKDAKSTTKKMPDFGKNIYPCLENKNS